MKTNQILIVEDEILIADTIERYLIRQGYRVVGKAISCEEAEVLYRREKPDLALLDIRLNGFGTGIDFARFIRTQAHTTPFIYLTSQLDRRSIDRAKETFPAGYLTKPIQRESLYTTIEMALYAHAAQKPAAPSITLHDGDAHHKVPLDDILYLQADHVYVQMHLAGGDRILLRRSLTEFLAELPAGQFVQTHRSYAVNGRRVSRWDGRQVYIGERIIPLSRGRRQEVLAALATG